MDTNINKLVQEINSDDLILIAGRPCTGKTFLSLQLSSAIAKETNKKILCFSYECSPELLYQHIKEKLNDDYLNKNIKIMDGVNVKTLQEIKENITKVSDVGIVIIDYLQLLQTLIKIKDNNEILQGLKAMAKEIHVPMIIVSQLGIAVENSIPTDKHLQNIIDTSLLDRILFTYFNHSFYINK